MKNEHISLMGLGQERNYDEEDRNEQIRKDRMYLSCLRSTDKKWMDEALDAILNEIILFC